jgi:hypothetical protein
MSCFVEYEMRSAIKKLPYAPKQKFNAVDNVLLKDCELFFAHNLYYHGSFTRVDVCFYKE